MVTLSLIAAIVLGWIALSVLVYWGAMRLVQAEESSFGRAILLTLILTTVGGLIAAGTAVLADQITLVDERTVLSFWAAVAGATVIVNIAIIAVVCGASLGRSVVILLAGAVAGAGGLAIVNFVVRPHLLETFVVPTNGMAPTVLGWHHSGTCPLCGGEQIVPGAQSQILAVQIDPIEPPGLCTVCNRPGISTTPKSPLEGPDRIVCNKQLARARWDVIVFRSPLDSKSMNVGRLVGMPGEMVFLDEGEVWINGVKLPRPEGLGKWTYESEREDGEPTPMGGRANPWKLGPNEYCVLGDFGWRSSDSRDFGPVPGENIEGVVALCYWPLSRGRLFR